VAFALRAASFTGAPLVVASVGAGGGEHAEDDLRHPAGAALEELQRNVDAEGVNLQCVELASSSAARALHEAAEERDAGLLVVGSTNRGSAGRVLVGSTAERLMHGAPCAIAIVPHGWQAGGGLNTLGVAYADTPEGHQALHEAAALARRAGAKLRVLTAVKPSTLKTYGEQTAGGDIQRGRGATEVEGEWRVRTEGRLRDVIADLGDLNVESDVFVEDPADALIAVSQNVDLLVCGSRGYGPLHAVLLGGVTRRVVAEAQCPVIVLPRGVRAPLEALTAAPGVIAA
jgi:nucleotide-binding universal stress UspA family protein